MTSWASTTSSFAASGAIPTTRTPSDPAGPPSSPTSAGPTPTMHASPGYPSEDPGGRRGSVLLQHLELRDELLHRRVDLHHLREQLHLVVVQPLLHRRVLARLRLRR